MINIIYIIGLIANNAPGMLAGTNSNTNRNQNVTTVHSFTPDWTNTRQYLIGIITVVVASVGSAMNCTFPAIDHFCFMFYISRETTVKLCATNCRHEKPKSRERWSGEVDGQDERRYTSNWNDE